MRDWVPTNAVNSRAVLGRIINGTCGRLLGFILSGEDEAMKIAPKITLTDVERTTLARWSRGRSTASRLVLRAKIVLLAAEGKMNRDIAAELRTGTSGAAEKPPATTRIRSETNRRALPKSNWLRRRKSN